jgi:hypothetical protein
MVNEIKWFTFHTKEYEKVSARKHTQTSLKSKKSKRITKAEYDAALEKAFKSFTY